MTPAKPFWASKTMWANAVGGVAMFATAAGIDLGLTPEAQAQVIGGIMVVVNVILRFVTKQPVGMGDA